jgi:hypothetical protein
LGIGDWGLGPIPNPQSPIPNPQSPYTFLYYLIIIHLLNINNNDEINCSKIINKIIIK